jgi:ATP-dependent helicase/DNAse subunit B
MPRLLLAPAGHGKTENTIQRIRQVLADQPLAPVNVIVPNTIQAAGFRQRLASSGGALGVEIFTFHSLYAELLARAAQPIPLLVDPVRIRLLRAITDDLYQQGEIRHFAVLRDKPGFITALRNTIEELKRARIFPDDFASAVNGLEARLEEISRVYSAYQKWLQEQNWADNEGRGWLATLALESDPALGTDTRFLAVCGFDEFNPTQLGVLSILARRAQEALITLTGDAHRPQRPAHRRFQRAQMALTESLHVQPEALDSTSLLAPAIAQVERSLFEPIPAKGNAENGKILFATIDRRASREGDTDEIAQIDFIESQTRPAEARAALD